MVRIDDLAKPRNSSPAGRRSRFDRGGRGYRRLSTCAPDGEGALWKVYANWRDFERLPTFMYHLESVTTTGEGRSHWVAKGPGGLTVEWDAEVTDDVPGDRIAWRSLPGTKVDNAGSVRLRPAPGGQGTEVRVELTYSPPGGALGSVVAKLFGEEPDQQVSDDLRRFKQMVETGEIETDRPHALRQAITSCRNGGVVSLVGVYGGVVDKFPIGSLMNRSLTVKSGQCHVHRYMKPLLAHIEAGRIDPTFIITHRLDLDEAPAGYETFKHKQDACMKVVLTPSA